MHHEGVLLGDVEAEMAWYDCCRFFTVAIWSAFLLAVGNFCYASTGGSLGYAISYSLSRGTLLVSALWGIFYYHEFRGANCKTWTTQLSALYFIVAAILCVAMA